jgi:hypothetical protein
MRKVIPAILIFVAVVTCVYSVHDFNARYLEIDIKYTLKSDGTQIYDYFHRVELLNSTRGLGESFIKYNPKFQKLEVISSVTTMADGRKVKTPENGYNEVLPYSAKRFAGFSGLKEMVISHTGIERGAEIELRYRIVTRKGFAPYFTGKEFLTKGVPVDKYTLTIKIPKTDELNYRVFNCSLKPERTIENGVINYTFTQKNVADYRQNSYVKNYDRPHIIFSNLKNPNKLFSDIFIREGSCKKFEDIISEIKKKKLTGPELLINVKKEIIDTFVNCHVDLQLSGFKTRRIGDIVESGYATLYEKVLISKQLLGRFGFKSKLVSISPGFRSTDNLFSYLQSTGLIFVVSLDEGDIYIDPGKNGTDFHGSGYCGLPLVDVENGKVLSGMKPDSKNNKLILNGEILLKDNKINGNLKLFTSGSFFRYSGFLKDKDSIYRSNVGRMLPVSKVKNIKVLRVTPAFAEISGDFETRSIRCMYEEFLFLKSFMLPEISGNMISKAQIMYPITIASPFFVEVSLSLKIDDNYVVDKIKQNSKIDNDVGTFEYLVKEKEKNHLDIYLKFVLKKGRIEKGDYRNFKQLINAALGGEFQLILKKKG